MSAALSDTFCQTEAQSCIVIHPGSRYLRIGRPSESAPFTLLHAVALKKRGIGPVYSDTFSTQLVKLDKIISHEIDDCRLKVSHILQSSFTSDGTRRFATPPQQVATFNKRSYLARVEKDLSEAVEWNEPKKDFLVGEEILRMKPSLDYNIHFPFKNGDLNLHSQVGGSLTAVMSHLAIIWKSCITNLLNIPMKALNLYRAVLVIPDIYNRDYVTKLTDLLLNELGFNSCFVIQDHVAATFGAGFGAACVIDVGDQKTSISCVEDGISHPNTRIRMNSGGGDISQVFYWLLKKCSFPYAINQASKNDAMLLNELKHEFCHINLDLCGAQEKELTVRSPGEAPCVYQVQMGDERIIAPLSLFYPDMLKITGTKYVTTQRPNEGHPQDPLDENFLRESTKLRGRETLDVSEVGEEEDIVIDSLPSVGPITVNKGTASVVENVMPLEEAILTSIEKCGNDELKRKMYSTILVVGGGAKFDQFGKWLENRLNLQIPLAFRSDQVEVTTKPKDLDPSMTVWKGASLLTCLEGSSELWISKTEWNKEGVKILREKCPFLW